MIRFGVGGVGRGQVWLAVVGGGGGEMAAPNRSVVQLFLKNFYISYF